MTEKMSVAEYRASQQRKPASGTTAPDAGRSASSSQKNDTQPPAATRRTSEEIKEHRRSGKARPLFSSTVWDLSEEEPRYRWCAHDLTQAQKDYLDQAAEACGIRPGR
ncbi:hypothetical protein K3G63_11020 [Hymenobacter sp. HSC-4F20]|uniref:hypothetical protein n=1 Tax=Hymenobacter sp. HSC-4F20 TaxID=2864135 RepID=UPI001C72B88A|nr:hypothetical protein [Hymenobacter sp. HSC-4F20]MBX0290974.1 hypothetical protein [Hymenobacter sp. HSC-4F20]